MNENLRSILIGTSGLSAATFVALLLTILRRPVVGDGAVRERTARLFLIGLAARCLLLWRSPLRDFRNEFPPLLGLPAWRHDFFVVFNLTWLSVWILSAVGLD
jgi:hypothetical protein